MNKPQPMPDTRRLTDLVDAETLQAVQGAIAGLTGMAAAICDDLGAPVLAPSGPADLAAVLRAADLQAFLGEAPVTTPASRKGWLYGAPVQMEGRTIGALVVAASAGAGPPPGGRPGVTPIIELLASMLSRLAGKTQLLQRLSGTLNIVHGITDLLRGTQGLQALLDHIARQVCDLMQVKACSIRLLDESGEELTIKAVHNLSTAYLRKGAFLVKENPIDRAALAGEAVYVEDAGTDPRIRFPEQSRKEGIVSGLSVDMTYRGQTVGVMRIYSGRLQRFTPAEIVLLKFAASQAAAAILHRQLYLEALEAEGYERQLHYAGAIQRRMIPQSPPAHPRLEFACVYEPSSEVGGDFYDFFVFSDSDQLGVCIADVVGKGLPAALLMAALRTAFRLYVYGAVETTETMTMTNIHMCRETQTSEFATLFYGVFEDDGLRLTYCNAGHDPPLLASGGQLTPLKNDNFVIGVDMSQSYEKASVKLQPGDAVLLYTDGLVDAVNFSGEAFGRSRLAAAMLRYAGLSADLIARNLIWDIRRFAGLADQADDITLVVAKVK
jgi:sigma-B regulation protein RsbU (phosphoserine phosphatase)